jgi:REP element-mobilizing transposase RayT
MALVAMTAPRRLLPGTTYLLTRRCSQRQFLLRPCAATNQVFGFLLAVAARRFDVDVHACCLMSNHVHLVVTDRSAKLPAFQRFLDSLVARAMNALLHRWEHFWAPSSYSAVALQGPGDILDKVAYVLANPVAAGLVRRGRLWPGLWLGPEHGQLQFERPGRFFRKAGATSLPEAAGLALTTPPGFTSAAAFHRALAARLEQRETLAELELRSSGRTFLGVAAVLAQRPTARPLHPEPRRGLSPRVACRDKWRRIQALGHLVEFLHAYRAAFQSWRAGRLDAVFPAGTYLMRVLHGVACAAPD